MLYFHRAADPQRSINFFGTAISSTTCCPARCRIMPSMADQMADEVQA